MANVSASIFHIIQYLTIDLPEIWAGVATLCFLVKDEAKVLRALDYALILLWKLVELTLCALGCLCVKYLIVLAFVLALASLCWLLLPVGAHALFLDLIGADNLADLANAIDKLMAFLVANLTSQV